MWSAPVDLSQRYFSYVKQCLTDEEMFNKFKTTDDYNAVVGMSLPWQAPYFLNRIKTFPEIYSKMEEFKKNDTIGTPPMIDIEGMNISPNTLRHIQTLCDLTQHFGDLTDKTICELGVGYGGTAFTVGTYYKPKAYHLVDLPDVQHFALKYLNRLGITCGTINPPPAEFDLFISEWCFSEFDDEDIYKFYDKYVKNANNIYIASNLWDVERKQRLLNHMNADFNLEIIPEYPKAHWDNYIIVGKK